MTDVDTAPTPAAVSDPRWRRHVTVFIGGQTITLFGSMLAQYAVFWYLTVEFQSGVIMTLASGSLGRGSQR